MDSLAQNARTYVKVLQKCSSSDVARWKQEDLDRAVNWAQYFKRVSNEQRNNNDAPMTSQQ